MRVPPPNALRPFDEGGVRRGADGIKHYLDLPSSVVELVRTRVDATPLREAVVVLDGPRLNYRELWGAAARVAGGLREAGVSRGDRVAIRHGNGLEWVQAFLGTLMAGAVAVPVNTRLTESEASYVITDSGARTVLVPADRLPDGRPYVTDELGQDDLAAIFYTSGTTGFPKGAMTSHGNFLTSVENGVRVADVPRDEESVRTLVSVPLFHVAGCNNQLLPSIQEGGTTVVMPAFNADRFLHAIGKERIRVVASVPAIYWNVLSRDDIADYDLSGIGWATYGGAPIAPSLVHRIKKVFAEARVGNGFGLTETASLSTFLPDEWAYTHAESVGFAAPTVDLSLDHVPGRDTSDVGELLIRGANVVRGYWQRPDATEAAFRDGWLRTGDLARIDDEGRVYLVDRIKDMINRGGENVYSVEVENVLAAAPGVFEVVVVGVPDDMMGEKVGAVVVPVPGETFDGEAVLAYARERLADFKVPQFLRVQTDPLPRNPGGKVVKPLVREQQGWTA